MKELRQEAEMMDLARLKSVREEIDDIELSIPISDLIARFESLYTGLVSDVLREFTLLDQAVPNEIVPLFPDRTVAGVAFTVKSAPTAVISGEMEVRSKMLGALTPDSFVMWDTTLDEGATLWGGVMTAAALRAGVRAACIDGGVRDSHQIISRQFPLYYRYRSPNGSLGRCQIIDHQVPIVIGSVLVKPGDIVVGDIDGVVVIPRRIACEVLLRAEELCRDENTIFDWVDNGDSVEEITRKGGYF